LPAANKHSPTTTAGLDGMLSNLAEIRTPFELGFGNIGGYQTQLGLEVHVLVSLPQPDQSSSIILRAGAAAGNLPTICLAVFKTLSW